MRKQRVTRNLVQYASPYENTFLYQSIPWAVALKLFSAWGESSDEFSDLQELAHRKQMNAQDIVWVMAYLNGEVAGIVGFGANFHGEATIAHFAVSNVFRGRGFAKRIHAHALEQMSLSGLKLYSDSVDINNVAMLKVMMRNGCELSQDHTPEAQASPGELSIN